MEAKNSVSEEEKDVVAQPLEEAKEGNPERPEEKQPAAGERRWVWAFPLIEGVPPCPRGGHTATLAGQSLIIFGGHYYSGKELGYAYLNDVHILDVNQNRWIVSRRVRYQSLIVAENRRSRPCTQIQAHRGAGRSLHHHLRRKGREGEGVQGPARIGPGEAAVAAGP